MPNEIMNWTPPESKTMQGVIKYGAMAAVAGGGIYAFTRFAPTMIDAVTLLDTLMADTTSMLYTGAGLFLTVLLLRETLSPSGSINKVLQLPYWALVNGLTRFFITIDPLSPIDERIKSVRADQALFERQFETMEGIVSNLREKEGSFRKLSSDSQRMGVSANRAGKANVVELAAHNFGSYRDAADQLAAMRGRLEPILTTFQSIAQAADVTAQKLETERNILKVQWEAQAAVHAATDSANRILGRSKTQVWAMAEQANDVITSKYGEELGHLDHLKRSAQPFMDSIDLETGAYSEEMLKQVQSSGAKLIESTAATPLPAPSASPTTVSSFIQ